MRILVLGATGRTGKLLTSLALERGHEVNALVRDAKKLRLNHPGLTVMEGSLTERTSLNTALRDCEAILSALNISRTNDFPWSPLRTPKDFLSSVMRQLIELAPEHNVRRIIFTSAWGVAETRKDIPGWFRWFIEHSNIKYPYLDHARQEELVSASGMQWTSVRPAGLTNFRRQKETLVSLNNTPRPSITITRAAVATFMLDVLQAGSYIGEKPVISEASRRS